MTFLKKIWHYWDTTTGRVMTILGSLGLIFAGITTILNFSTSMIQDKPINCARNDLSLIEMRSCINNNNESTEGSFLEKQWAGKRVSWDAAYYLSFPMSAKKLKVETEGNNKGKYRVQAMLGAWGRESQDILFGCYVFFDNLDLAQSYFNNLEQIPKESIVKITGVIEQLTPSKLELKNCFVGPSSKS